MPRPTSRSPRDEGGQKKGPAARTGGDHGLAARAGGDRGRAAARVGVRGKAARVGGKPGGATGSDGEARGSLYDEVTARIIAELEAGRVPWVQPWRALGGGAASGPLPGLPHNALTGRAYSGINILILWGAVIERGWPSQGWLTFRQALAAGGMVRKGERGTTIVYADRFTPRRGGDATAGGASGEASGRGPGSGGGASDGDAGAGADSGAARSIAFLKRFTVFNVAQIDGLAEGFAERLVADPAPLAPPLILAGAEALVAASGVPVRIGGDEAYYAPGPDFIMVPPQAAFFDPLDWYRILLHELTHSTGHPRRLDRQLVTAFGSKDYAREELVAEMGSAFLCAALGIAPTLRHADYLAAWLAVLREDNRAILRAASAASKAADWLLVRGRASGDGEPEAAPPETGVDPKGGRVAP